MKRRLVGTERIALLRPRRSLAAATGSDQPGEAQLGQTAFLEGVPPGQWCALFLQTCPPIGEEGEKVGDADGGVAVERSKKPPAGHGRGCDRCDNSARAGYAVTRW